MQARLEAAAQYNKEEDTGAAQAKAADIEARLPA